MSDNLPVDNRGGKRFALGSYRFHYRNRRWECTHNGRGVGGCKTPLGAVIAVRRWERTPVGPA